MTAPEALSLHAARVAIDREAAIAASEAATSARPPVPLATAALIDLCGERLVFERAGVRLLQTLLAKLVAADGGGGGPEARQIEALVEEKLLHAQLLARAIEGLGADPGEPTPGGALAEALSSGLLLAVADPQVPFEQSLKALLWGELLAVEGWETLAELAVDLGREEIRAEVQQACEEAQEHLALLRTWQANLRSASAGLDREAAAPASP